MVIKNVNLETVCGITSTIPENEHYEVAFAGKSNVGKSSLINALLNRNSLARTSSQPGKTQTINFYNVNDMAYLVDLPGYGYARANIEIKAKWGQMIERYFSDRPVLRGVISLVDGRHEPTELDCQMIDFLHYYDLPILVCATKMDKIPRGKWNRTESQIRKKLALNPQDEIVLFSSVTKAGKEEVWNWVEKMSGIKGD